MSTQENHPPGVPIGSEEPVQSDLDTKKPEGSPAVRFASVNEEIEPAQVESLESVPHSQPVPAQEQEQLRELSKTLQNTQIQERRMSHFAFEPVSLPASRVPSNEDSSREASRQNTYTSSSRPSPHNSPRPLSMHSPPITPAATRSRDAVDAAAKGAPLQKVDAEKDSTAVTPQISPPGTSGTSPSTTNVDESRPGSSGTSTKPSTTTDSNVPKHHGDFSIGPATTDSVPPSRDPSPTRSATYTRPFTPAGDVNDPYAASRRQPQSRNLDAIDPRFKFTAIGSKHRSTASSSSVSLPRSSRSQADMSNSEKRHSSIFGGGHKEQLSHLHDDSSATISSKHGSMSELKRFLKIGGHSKSKRSASPKSGPVSRSGTSQSGTRTPPHHKTPTQLPFDDNHGLTSKYGKFGKVLGAGAGGSVRVMKRSNGTTFAVKEFRARHSYESEKEYAKKVTAEFCVGSTLHHGNIIETLDIVQEKGKWYEVMEYAPYDLFAIVMTGKMSKEEVSCSFLQILSGVTYLHSMGLAHRDLKLDNVVVNEHGIMKIIDFGSASVFKYPFEGGVTLASGIVGSDPYLAPEVYEERKYDPQPADIWSLAIIFCCMSLRRFPWKMPRMTDNSYKLFASAPTPGTEIKRLSVANVASKSTTDLDTPARDAVAAGSKSTTEQPANGNGAEKKPEVIKGPWRLLRLLPRETRNIMAHMLQIDPKNRATMEDILADPWVSTTNFCRQEEGGRVIKAQGHTHTLEPPSAAPGPTK